ncbi:uncharacterized protein [Macrobrachium rosenbergii]|uniref:Crustin 3 n=1 Tax=Macrobrachium rosenbergii TaxID=79674 RepID=A0A173G7W4_MACRS|nr:crustin 3 [Macrobrachium rosenbergii]
MKGLFVCSLAIIGVVVGLPEEGEQKFFNGPDVGHGDLAPVPGSAGQGVAPPATCKHWCRAPRGQAYCCEGVQEPEGPVGIKPGNCPRVRNVCPPVRTFSPPNPCSNDYRCFGSNKCCYDVCLKEHVCKPPSYFF